MYDHRLFHSPKLDTVDSQDVLNLVRKNLHNVLKTHVPSYLLIVSRDFAIN